MADILVMLALSPTMEEGQLVKWLKNEGDTVASGDVVAEVETDKATMELESFLDGVLLKRLVAEGESVPVGQGIAVIGEAGEDISGLVGGDGAQPSRDAATETRPAAAAQPAAAGAAPVAATPQRQPRQTAPQPQREAARAAADGGRIIASPLARKLAEERGIDLAQLEGSGPQGRIIKRDVEAAQAAGKRTGAAAAQAQAPALPGAFVPDAWAEDVEATPLSSMRRTIARRLGQSWVGAPHFFLQMSIRMDAAWGLREQLNRALVARERGKISVNDLIVKACALALQEVPAVNVAFADDGMRQFEGSHIGIAVAVPDGLIVPVVRDAHIKSLSRIGAETRDLATRARDKKLKPAEMTGSTFSVSNLGMYGIDAFTAVINPPEACILAVGAVTKQAVVDAKTDQISVARVMNVTLSCDHRAVDGATGAEFLGVVRAYLEDPMLLVA